MKITVKQLRQIIREEVVRSMRLTEADMMKSDDFNAAAKKAGVDAQVDSDVEIQKGEGGVAFKQGGKQMKLSPEDARDIYAAHAKLSKTPMGKGPMGGGG